MTAWIEDAQILTEIKELSRSEHSVLLRTAEVQDFLEDTGLSSQAIVAPKGFGKTFVLKLKRLSLQDNGYRCFPQSMSIVDRPSARPPILAKDIISILESSNSWETLWQIAFAVCAIKGYQDDPEVRAQTTRLADSGNLNLTLRTIVGQQNITTPFDIIHDCISAKRNEIFSTLGLAQHFTRIFPAIRKQAAIFVDNIDEYLLNYINFSYVKRGNIHDSFLRVWHSGQIGAWLALRRLHGINPHVRIFVCLRKEAYHEAQSHEADFSNLRSFRRELRYTQADIRQIIENNIRAESVSKLVDKTNRNPILRFLGPQNEFIANSGTAKQESVLDYWLRHCSLRPRDAVAIGHELSLLRASERSQHAIRSKINNAAAERVETLFAEVAPFVHCFYSELFPKIVKSNVLSRQDILDAAREYTRLASEQYDNAVESETHPFCALYAMGLLGIVQQSRDNHGTLIQHFAPVGEIPFGGGTILPRAEIYVVHPALSDFIIRRNVSFIRALSKHNVIGDGHEWRPEEEVRFVAKGDVRGYRDAVMHSVGGSQTFERYWEGVFRQFTVNLDYAVRSEGDSLLIADRSPSRLLRALRGLIVQLEGSRYNLLLRVGAHSGFWRLNQDVDGVPHPEISDIVGVAARIEPLANPGDILVTQQFIDDAHRKGFSFGADAPTKIGAAYLGPERYDEKLGVLISKDGKENAQRVHLYLVRK